MTQDTHHSEHDTNSSEIKKSRTSLTASFWFVIIILGLFISALNFVNIESNDKGEGKIVETPKPVKAQHEASPSQTLAGENGHGKAVDSAPQTNIYTKGTMPDSLKH